MARFGALVLVLLVVSSAFLSSAEGRKLVMNDRTTQEKNEEGYSVPPLFKSLLLVTLAKGAVPSSSPSKKGHATLDNEKLFQRHLASIDRMLGVSVPSPGAGH